MASNVCTICENLRPCPDECEAEDGQLGRPREGRAGNYDLAHEGHKFRNTLEDFMWIMSTGGRYELACERVGVDPEGWWNLLEKRVERGLLPRLPNIVGGKLSTHIIWGDL